MHIWAFFKDISLPFSHSTTSAKYLQGGGTRVGCKCPQGWLGYRTPSAPVLFPSPGTMPDICPRCSLLLKYTSFLLRHDGNPYSVDFDTCILSWIHHYSVIKNNSTVLKKKKPKTQHFLKRLWSLCWLPIGALSLFFFLFKNFLTLIRFWVHGDLDRYASYAPSEKHPKPSSHSKRKR